MMYREKDYLLKVMTDSNDIAKASTLPEMIEKKPWPFTKFVIFYNKSANFHNLALF